MDSDFQSRLNALIDASDGQVWLVSGDRDTETQTRLWNEAVAKYGPEEARNWVAPPGHSNHEKGIAADLGGNLELAAQLAPQFGLYRPMSWEPWHFEPVGSRGSDSDPQAYTTRPSDPSALLRGTQTRDYGDVLAELLNIQPFTGTPIAGGDVLTQQGGTDPLVASNPGFAPKPPMRDSLTAGPDVAVPGLGGRNGASMGDTDLDRFMAALRAVESSHNYQAEGPPTPWGTATGAYQYLDGTWDNYKGYARAKDAPPEIQDEKARMDMQNYYNEYGSWDSVAAAWYSGPGGNWQSSEVRQYVAKVNRNLG